MIPAHGPPRLCGEQRIFQAGSHRARSDSARSPFACGQQARQPRLVAFAVADVHPAVGVVAASSGRIAPTPACPYPQAPTQSPGHAIVVGCRRDARTCSALSGDMARSVYLGARMRPRMICGVPSSFRPRPQAGKRHPRIVHRAFCGPSGTPWEATPRSGGCRHWSRRRRAHRQEAHQPGERSSRSRVSWSDSYRASCQANTLLSPRKVSYRCGILGGKAKAHRPLG